MENEKVATAEAITTNLNAKLQNNSETPQLYDPEKFISAEKLLTMEVTSIPCLFEPIIPKTGLGLLGGESDAGKSMLLRQLAISATLGIDFLGFKYRGNHKGVLYISTEDDMGPTSVMMKKEFAAFQKEPSACRNLHFLFSSFDTLNKIEYMLLEEPIELVILDSLSDLFDEQDMNSSSQVRRFLKKYKELSLKYDCFFLFLHHIGKGKEELAPSKNSFVGSQSFEAVVRVCLMLFKDSFSDEVRHFCIAKHNYLGPEYKNQSWELNFSSETYTFTPTGNRVPIKQLVVNGQKKKVSEFANDMEYVHFLCSNFKNAKPWSQWLDLVKKTFHCGQENAEKIILNFFRNNWIKNENGLYSANFDFFPDGSR